jgi:signal transduction histidine kinase/ligand-binding sensor domain-containing protein
MRWILLALVATVSLEGQAPRAAEAPPGPISAGEASGQSTPFTHLTLEHGLSDQRVQALLQDSDGFMWFGTNNGLNRYDGHDVVQYRNDPTNPNSLSGNWIEELYEDRSGTLWVGTRSGLNAFDRRTERFTRYRHDPADPSSLSDNTVIRIYEDRSQVLWLGTAGGLNRFDRATGRFTAYRHDPQDPHSLGHDAVRDIAEDRTGTLWVGTLNGLSRFDRVTAVFTTYRHDPANPRSLSHDVAWDIQEDRAGRLWVGTDGGGLNRYDPTTDAFIHYRHDPDSADSLSGDRIASIFEDASGALWVSTFGSGLSVLDPDRRRFRRYRQDSNVPTSLGSDYLDEIVSDRSGLIWIGTHGSGVVIHDPRPSAFTIYRHDPRISSLASNNVWTVAEDRDGILWVGTQDRGLDRIDRQTGQVVHYPPEPNNPRRLGYEWVSALEPDPTGALWVGTYGGGLYRLDEARASFTAYRYDRRNPRSLSHDAIADLHRDRSGNLWIGTRGGGLNRFDPASGRFVTYRYDPVNPMSVSSDWVWAIADDARGNLWIGTLGGGLNRLDPATGRFTRFQHDPQDPTSLSDDSIWTLHVDRSGVLWVGTIGGGLDRFDPEANIFVHHRERDGLASDRVISILEDGRADDANAGNLWIATGRGLSKLERDRKTFRTYGATHGLPLTEYNRGGHTARNGELLISSIHGLIAFDPNEVVEDHDVREVVLTDFLLANKPVAVGDGSPLQQAIGATSAITLTHADRMISFKFAALNYRTPQQTRYRYRLEGFDDDWIEVGSARRLVTYTNLAPGRYVFRVTAANADGVWNPAGRAISLVVTPPWWATWWFRGLALALIAGCAAGIYVLRVGSLERRRRALEAEIVERKKVEAALLTSHRQIQDLAGRLITAQEEERSRIARELHDDVTQRLAALSISLGAVQRRLPQDLAEEHRQLASLQQQAVAASESIRSLSHELHHAVLQHFGLVAALKGTCLEFGSQRNIEVVFHADKGLGEIPADIALCLYRVAQEALHNAARHADAHRVEVALASSESDSLELRITDDGRGFDVAQAKHGGLGLVSIDERVRLVAGHVRIRSEQGKGTELQVHVPLRPIERIPVEKADESTEGAAC